MKISENVKTIGIIGTGVAGLAAARLLTAAGYECQLFEKGERVGGVWTVGYHTFGLQTPASLYEIPDYPMPKEYPRLPSGAQLQAYFESYIKQFGLLEKINFNTKIEKLQDQDDGSWVVHYKNHKTEVSSQQTFDFIVVATGLYSTPFTPEFPGREKFLGKVLHSSEYLDPNVVKDHQTVVVGFGKSALDIAIDATRYAKKVTLLFRQAHWPIPVDILNLIDVRRIFLNRLVLGFMPLYQRPSAYAQKLHQYAPWLVNGFWKFVEMLLRIQFPLKATNTLPEEPAKKDFFNHAFLPRNETYTLIQQNKINAVKGNIKEFYEQGIILQNDQKIPCDSIIFSTGWQQDSSFLPVKFNTTIDKDGVYLYRHILHPELNNMAFIGWASTFSNSLTSHLASAWLVKVLQGVVKIPSKQAQENEVELIKQWKRSFMPEVKGRATLLQLHMWNYHDELLQDAGINPRRKSNWLTEWLQDYRPSDYKDVLTEIKPLNK